VIAKLNGQVDSKGDDWAIVSVQGIGYLVFCSQQTLAELSVNEKVILHIETHVREDHIHLYGFVSIFEQRWFRLLITVQGVGAKVALAILSSLSLQTLTQSILTKDKATICQANGVGPKLAIRILSELREKVNSLILEYPVQGSHAGKSDKTSFEELGINANHSDAVSALINLGYSTSDAQGAVSHTLKNLGNDINLNQIIKSSLVFLKPHD